MEGNLEVSLKKEWHTRDLFDLTYQIRDHESLIRLKRRWLMDLPLSMTEQKKVEEMLPPNDKILPESLIREDDVSYEDIRTAIEMGFGAYDSKKKIQSTQEAEARVFNPHDCRKKLYSLLDDMTNKGLCLLIEVLTEGMINFEKTNSNMKKMIKELLSKGNNISETKLKQLSQLLQDPTNFKGGQLVCSTVSEAYRAAAIDALDRLEDFPTRALLAMRRKLSGVKTYVPTLHPPRFGQSRDKLSSTLKNMCMAFLSDLDDANEPAEELVGALGVAGLTLKLILNCSDVRDFRRFSPEIEALQNDIAKAIHLLSIPKRVSLIELKKVQVLLDPNLKLSANSLRDAVRGLLTEYLFECSDMGSLPDSLVETVNIINTRSQLPSRKKRESSKSFSSPQELMRDAMQKEVEHVLTVSAQAKEVVLNSLTEDFDEDFARAYSEDFEGNDSLCNSDDEEVGIIPGKYELHSCDSYGSKSESIGETQFMKIDSTLPTSERDYGCSPVCSLSCKELILLDSTPNGCKVEEATNLNCVLFDDMDGVIQQRRSTNKYLEIQDACDASSMVAYRFVGRFLDKLAKIEGLDLYKGDRLYLGSDSSDANDSVDVWLTSQFSEMWKDMLQS